MINQQTRAELVEIEGLELDERARARARLELGWSTAEHTHCVRKMRTLWHEFKMRALWHE